MSGEQSNSPVPIPEEDPTTLRLEEKNLTNLKAAFECDVCHRNVAKGVASSCFGAVSLAYCEECLNSTAEAEFIFEYLYSFVSDHGEGLVAEMNDWSTFKDGKYWSWQEWLAWRKAQPDLPPPPDPVESLDLPDSQMYSDDDTEV